MSQNDIPIYSLNDVLQSLKNYRPEVDDESFEIILYFVSSMTGMSIDTIMERL